LPEPAEVAAVSGINSVPPLPHTPTYDPLGRAMTEDQKTRLQDQPSKPGEQTDGKERIADRRREGQPRRKPREPGDDDDGPGRIIDSYA
jgi:hypothetical protein